jgi:SAM-dependent methyltransferase
MLTPQMDLYENVGQICEGKRVLEIGFGTGFGVLQYAGKAEYVDAVEIDQAAVEFARKVFPLRNVRWLHDDFCNPTHNFKGYDLVLMIEVLEHLDAFDKVMGLVGRAMNRPGGAAIFTVPNSLRHRRRREALNVREWTPGEFLDALRQIFPSVWLLDASLGPWVTGDERTHRETPIVAGVRHGR